MGALLSKLLEFIFKKTTPKFMVFAGLYFVVFEFFPELVEWAGVEELILNLSNDFGSLPSSIGYFLAPFNIGLGLKLLITSYITRFVIRRIPIIG